MPAENLTGSGRLPNVVLEWVALKLHILEVPGINMYPQTNLTEVFGGFPQSLHGNSGIIPQITLRPLSEVLTTSLINLIYKILVSQC
jgi:hypothetical protein